MLRYLLPPFPDMIEEAFAAPVELGAYLNLAAAFVAVKGVPATTARESFPDAPQYFMNNNEWLTRRQQAQHLQGGVSAWRTLKVNARLYLSCRLQPVQSLD